MEAAPLLQGGDIAEKLRKLVDERYPVYKKADITVHSRDVPHDVVVDEILIELERCLVPAETAPDMTPKEQPDDGI